MYIPEEVKQKIIENNSKISDLLLENENLLRIEGLNIPEQNFALISDDKIKVPRGYIRSKEYLVFKYHLKEIASDWVVRSNIGYALQLSDFHNYLLNRFDLWGSVSAMMYKSAVINLVSILEAMVFEVANQICCNSSKCTRKRSCKISFNKKQRENSYEAIKRINELGITSFSSDELSRIKELIDLRNRVHIRLAEEKEISDKEFNLELYNEIIKLLQRTCDELYKNAVPLYKSCYHQ